MELNILDQYFLAVVVVNAIKFEMKGPIYCQYFLRELTISSRHNLLWMYMYFMNFFNVIYNGPDFDGCACVCFFFFCIHIQNILLLFF